MFLARKSCGSFIIRKLKPEICFAMLGDVKCCGFFFKLTLYYKIFRTYVNRGVQCNESLLHCSNTYQHFINTVSHISPAFPIPTTTPNSVLKQNTDTFSPMYSSVNISNRHRLFFFIKPSYSAIIIHLKIDNHSLISFHVQTMLRFPHWILFQK